MDYKLSNLVFFICVFVRTSPVYLSRLKGEPSLFEVEYISRNATECSELEVEQWKSNFHECFILRKYNDGGMDLENIVDRIMDHSQVCAENASRECRPNFKGFLSLLSKIVSQMQDYSEMYLSEIYKGREKIRDLKCVEEELHIKTYRQCFLWMAFDAPDMTKDKTQDDIRNSMSCVNKSNRGCSSKAKTTLNRIVKTLLGVSQMVINETVDMTITQSPRFPSSQRHSSPTTHSHTSPTTHLHTFPTTHSHTSPDPTPAPSKPWYRYIIDPIISAWNTVTSWIGSWFG